MAENEFSGSRLQSLLRAAEAARAEGEVPGSGGAKAGGAGAESGISPTLLRGLAGEQSRQPPKTNAMSPNPAPKYTPDEDEAEYQGAVNPDNAVHQMVVGGKPRAFQVLDKAGEPVKQFGAKMDGSWVYLLNEKGYPEFSAQVSVSKDGKHIGIHGLDDEGDIGRGLERIEHLVSGGRGILASGARFFGADETAEKLEVGVGDVEREEGLVRLRAKLGFADAPHVKDLGMIEGLGSGVPFIAGQAGLAKMLHKGAGMGAPAAAATSSAALTVPVVGGEGGEALEGQTGEETGMGVKAGMGGTAAAGTSLTEGLMAMMRRRGGQFIKRGRTEGVQEAGDEAIELGAQDLWGLDVNAEDYEHAAQMGFTAGATIGSGAELTGRVGGQIQARKLLDEAATARGLKGKEKDEIVRLALSEPKERVADIVDGMTDKQVDELMFLEGAEDKREALTEAVELVRQEAVVAGASLLSESEAEEDKAQDAIAKKRWGAGWRKKQGLEEKDDRELEDWQDSAEGEFYRGIAELKGIVGTGEAEEDNRRVREVISALGKGGGAVEAKVEEFVPLGAENAQQSRKSALDIIGKMAKNLDETAVANAEVKRRRVLKDSQKKFDRTVGRKTPSDYNPVSEFSPIDGMSDEELRADEKLLQKEMDSDRRRRGEIPAEEQRKIQNRIVAIWEEQENRALKAKGETKQTDEQPPAPPAPPKENPRRRNLLLRQRRKRKQNLLSRRPPRKAMKTSPLRNTISAGKWESAGGKSLM